MTKIIGFKEKEKVDIRQVGGKAKSLIHMTQGSFNVPDGIVLTVDFFSEWLDKLMEMEILNEEPMDFKSIADYLKEKAKNFEFTKLEKELIEKALDGIEGNIYAVRSSSPEEDLVSASFAGGYETILGSTIATLFDDIKKAFISCLDERVFFYKAQNGFDVKKLSIAVIIQKQIASEVSGVGFSLNPLNNAYDEVVINSNFGLGESVVAGQVTPDEYIVDKIDWTIQSKILGSKEERIHLNELGGTSTVSSNDSIYSLSDEQVILLSKKVDEIEKYYGSPVDIEWAFEGDELYILQSRPITTYVPLPEFMKTEPGEQKILYLDGSLTKQGVTVPISHIGCQVIELLQNGLFEDMMGNDVVSDPKGGLATTKGGRMYVNLSSTMKMQNQKRVAASYRSADYGTSELIENSELSEYIPKKTPEPIKGVMWNVIKNNLGTLKKTRAAIKDPKAYKEWYQPKEDAFDKYLIESIDFEQDIKGQTDIIAEKYITLLSDMMVMTYAAEFSRSRIKKILSKAFDDGEEKMQFLERSLPDNVTIDMGLKLYDLSKLIDFDDLSEEMFLEKLKNDTLPLDFQKAWNHYMNLYGCRTTVEIDMASIRPYEEPLQVFKQIKGMSTIDEEMSPYGIYKASIEERERTHGDILNQLSGKTKKKYEKHYNSLVLLGGKREALKYWMIRTVDAIRRLVMKEANNLVRLGLIESVEDIYWLDFDKIDQYKSMEKENINKLIEVNKAYYVQLNQVKNFPKIIDSRGKIIAPLPVEVKDGELAGQPISPGFVKGRVKVLRTPDEKELLPGEILVTKATDPGWTPLFINASAIILEVGGVLQHGALVAREYGKPCIAGIENVVNILEDGMEIEVDATRGILRVVK